MKRFGILLLITLAAVTASGQSIPSNAAYCLYNGGWIPLHASLGIYLPAPPPAVALYGSNGSAWYPLACDVNGNLQASAPTTAQVQSAINGQAITPSTVAASTSVSGGTTTPTIISASGVTFPDGTTQATKSASSVNPYCQAQQTDGTATLWQCENFAYWDDPVAGTLNWVTETGPINFGSQPSAKYCVDSVNGSDSNAGTCTPVLAPYATLAKLQTNTFNSGDSIALAANSQFRESLTLSASNMTLSAYGVGTRPLIDGSNVVPGSSFTLVSGDTYTYQFTLNRTAASNSWPNVFENGVQLQYATSAGAAESTAGSFFIYNYTAVGECSSSISAPCTIYVHPFNNTNPISDGNLYEVAARNVVLSTGSSQNETISGVWVRRCLLAGESLMIGSGNVVHDVLVTDGSDHSIIIGAQNNVLANVVADGFYIPNSAGFGTGAVPIVWFFTPSGTGEYEEFDDLIISSPSVIPNNGTSFTGMIGHNDGSSFTAPLTVTCRFCKTFNVPNPFQFGMASSVYVIGSEAHGAVVAAIFGDSSHTLLLNVNGFRAEKMWGQVINSFEAGAVVTANNLNVNGCCYGILAGISTASISMSNSVLTGTWTPVYSTSAIGNFSFTGNTVGGYYAYTANALVVTPTVFSSNYNNWTGGMPSMYIGGTQYTYANYKSTFSQDANSGPAYVWSAGWGSYTTGEYWDSAGSGDTRGSLTWGPAGTPSASPTITYTFSNPNLYRIPPLVITTYTGTDTAYNAPTVTTTGITWTLTGTPACCGTDHMTYVVYP